MSGLNSYKVRWVWGISFIIFGLFFYYIKDILLPFVAALILAYALNPGAERLQRMGLSRISATIVMVLFLFILIGGLLFGAIPFLKDELIELIKNFPGYTDRAYDAILPHLKKLNKWEDFAVFQQKFSEYIGDMVSWTIKIVINVLTGGLVLANLLSLVVITPILVFYLLRDWKIFLKNIEYNLPNKYRQNIVILGEEVNQSLGGYVRGQSIVCLALATIYTLGLWAVGLEYALTVGILSGLLAFIPYVGFIIGFTVAISLALAQFADWSSIGLVVMVYATGQILEATFLTPKLVGDRIGVHPVWIIFALLAGGSLFGFLGVLFALPIAAMVAVLVRAFMRTYRNSIYYRDDSLS